MKQSYAIFRNQLALFKCEKGMLVFYFICVTLVGIIYPLFFHNIESAISMSALLTVMFLKPILADSLASEREKKTLEPLLSSSIHGKNIIWGKLGFSLLFCTSFFLLTNICIVLTNYVATHKWNVALWQWACILLLSILNFMAISILGIYISAKSIDSRTANSKISRIAYPFGFLFIIYLSIVFLLERISVLFITFFLALVYFFIVILYIVKVSKMRQFSYFENIKIGKHTNIKKEDRSYTLPRSQFWIVFKQEWKYLLTLKTLLINFLILCVSPVTVVCLLKYYTGKIDLYYAVLLTILMIPRTPSSLIAYSIGGEKVYKTGESLLSTPLHLKELFLAKSTLPIFISIIMILFSAVLTLIGANIVGAFFENGITYFYSADQLILLFLVGIMSCITMVFLTGILSVNMKTPRQGLYVSSILGTIFTFPTLAIIYLTQDKLKWSFFYFFILLLCNSLCLKSISNKINRPEIMNKL